MIINVSNYVATIQIKNFVIQNVIVNLLEFLLVIIAGFITGFASNNLTCSLIFLSCGIGSKV